MLSGSRSTILFRDACNHLEYLGDPAKSHLEVPVIEFQGRIPDLGFSPAGESVYINFQTLSSPKRNSVYIYIYTHTHTHPEN